MAIDDEIAILQQAPIFQGMDPAKLRLLAVSSDRVRFKAGEHIYEKGEPAEDVLFILSGKVVTDTGFELKTLVGHVGTLLQRSRVTTVIAKTDVEALHIGRAALFDLIRGCSAISLAIIMELARLLDATLDPSGPPPAPAIAARGAEEMPRHA